MDRSHLKRGATDAADLAVKAIRQYEREVRRDEDVDIAPPVKLDDKKYVDSSKAQSASSASNGGYHPKGSGYHYDHKYSGK